MDARRAHYRTLLDWLRVYVRYALASIMLSYGLAKVFKSQFPLPSAGRLMEAYGESSPMGLLWTFMGYSTAYTVFTGAAEVLGGVLLFFRRTTTLGALELTAVLGNVVMLNFCYDVPVKLYSSNLLLMAVFLLGPDLRRLADFFVFGRPTEAAAAGLLPVSPRWRRARLGAKTLLVTLILFATTKDAVESWAQWGDRAPKSHLSGLYEIEEFVVNGEAQPPGSMSRWQRVSIDTYKTMGRLFVRRMDGSLKRFRVAEDETKRTLKPSDFEDESQQGMLSYARSDGEHLSLEGKVVDDLIAVRLRKVDLGQFLLVNRGFRWINERPYNR